MRTLRLMLLVLVAQVALAHDVPVNPSTCALDPIELSALGGGVSAVVSAPGPDDRARVVYSVATATAQFQQRTAAPRTFIAGGVSGTLGVPDRAFDAPLLTNGDLRADGVALAITLGGASISVPVTLTTAVAMAGSDVVTGTPMTADGRFTLVGLVPAGTLPAPFAAGTGGASRVSGAARARPRPVRTHAGARRPGRCHRHQHGQAARDAPRGRAQRGTARWRSRAAPARGERRASGDGRVPRRLRRTQCARTARPRRPTAAR